MGLRLSGAAAAPLPPRVGLLCAIQRVGVVSCVNISIIFHEYLVIFNVIVTRGV